ncbi:hypothetical protein [Paraburkholderia sediminicola]
MLNAALRSMQIERNATAGEFDVEDFRPLKVSSLGAGRAVQRDVIF